MRRSLAAGLLCAIVLAGCGSSSSSDRSKLLDKLQTSLQQSDSSLNTPDLVSCIVNQAKSLPTDQLKTAANAPANSTDSNPATQKVAFKLAAPCVAEGHGAAALRQQVLSQIQGSTSLSTLPASYSACVTAKAKTISNAQLASFLQAGEQGNAALHAAGEKLGRQYGTACLSDSTVLASMRAAFVKPIRSEVSSYSPAFGQCVLSQAEALSDTALRGLITHPSTAEAAAEKLGKGWAQNCVARGIKP